MCKTHQLPAVHTDNRTKANMHARPCVCVGVRVSMHGLAVRRAD